MKHRLTKQRTLKPYEKNSMRVYFIVCATLLVLLFPTVVNATEAGGIIITFTKEILDLITG